MRRLLLIPLAAAAILAPAVPAQAVTVCESVILLTGDQVDFCVDTTGGCVFIAQTGLNPPAPKMTFCQPNVLPGSPPYCNGLIGDVTVYVCFDDPNCPAPGISVEYGVPPTTTVCL